MNALRTIIVTGASSGIGAHCARALKADGWRVFATCRAAEDCSRLAAEGLEMLEVDSAGLDRADELAGDAVEDVAVGRVRPEFAAADDHGV